MFITLGRYKITCYLPPEQFTGRVVYLHTAQDIIEDIWRVSPQNFVLVAIDGIDWNREMSPWHHEKVFTKGEDFTGGADEYLEILTKQLIPAAEASFCLKPDKRYLVGYSLSGLFAVYAMYHTSLFDGIASVSGSLWFNGFGAYVEEHTVIRNPDKIYFSLGDKEAEFARGIMQTVFVYTKQIMEKFYNDGIDTILEMNEGNHFKQVPERIAKGIRWLV